MDVLGSANAVNSPSGILGRLVDDSDTIRTKVDQLSEQSSTGLVSQTYGGLGASAQISLDLRPQLARVDVYTQNISTASTRLSVSSSALGQLEQIASTFASSTIGLASETSQEVDTLAAQASAALTQVQSLMNTKVGNTYIFAGQDSSNEPMPDASFNSYVQGIKAAAGGLATAGAAATETATLAAATTVSPFSTTLGTTRQSVTVGFGVTAQIGIVAGQNAYASTTGADSTGSYVRDLVRSLATIAALNSSQTSLGADFTNFVGDTRTSLTNQVSTINDENAGLGESQQQLTMEQTTLSDTQQALTTQVSNVENVDAAATASAVTQAQTQLQISYKLIASMQNLSLVSYL